MPAYWSYVKGILPQLPLAAQELTRTSIHDGRVECAIYNPSAKSLRLELVCGGVALNEDYFMLTLVYEDVGFDAETLASICHNDKTEALYDELDIVAEDRFVHRIVFRPGYIDTEIEFKGLTLQTKPLAGRIRTQRDDRLIIENGT